MTLQNLSKILERYDQQLGITDTQQFEVRRDLAFFDWQNPEHTKTFNHAIGLPQKNGQSYPLFDYERMLFDTLQTNEHLWIKKATGLGVTEFMLRYMAWLCFNGSSAPKELIGSQMCIVTGPRIELAITLIDRLKGLFQSINSPDSGGDSLLYYPRQHLLI